MVKIDVVSLISGVIFCFVGVILLVLSFIFSKVLVFYSIIMLIIGIVILATLRQQDEIEQIKKVGSIKNNMGKKKI